MRKLSFIFSDPPLEFFCLLSGGTFASRRAGRNFACGRELPSQIIGALRLGCDFRTELIALLVAGGELIASIGTGKAKQAYLGNTRPRDAQNHLDQWPTGNNAGEKI
jgi:hypothetical protein